ncbi:MAG TPA: hypothetical protein DCX27_10865 [Balneola sp.]|nr:hypothetical protein [Balneola sp.]|tara:strand:- start:290 stop:1057 length:768 start_codon:yes stop_codon:yes gene_type:complete
MSKSLVSSIEAHDCVRTTYYKIKLSDECLADLQEYSAKVLLSPNVYEDYTHRLAGHIKGGKQLQIPLETKETKDLLKVLSSAAVQYYNNYISRVITNYSKIPSERNPYALKGVEVQDLWLNSYLAGDYNPIHKHGTYSPVGLSCFIFVSIPDSIKAKNNQARIASRSGGITGNDHYDGHTLLKWGYNFASDNVFDSLEYSQQDYVKPEEGMIYLFPRWMDHMVCPFRGPGLRVTMAANINIWTNKYYNIYNNSKE